MCLVTLLCLSLWDPTDCRSPGSTIHVDLPGKNTTVGCQALLQGIFPTQGSNPGLPYRRQILYHLSHQENPRIPEWVAYPFCKGSFWPRNQTGVSCIAGGFFTSWATREALFSKKNLEEKKKRVWVVCYYSKSCTPNGLHRCIAPWGPFHWPDGWYPEMRPHDW